MPYGHRALASRAASVSILSDFDPLRWERVGMRSPVWSERESAALRRLYPLGRAPDLLEALPARSWRAIQQHARLLGVSRFRRSGDAPRHVDPLFVRLKEIRCARRISQRVLAKRIGCDKSSLCGWESGRDLPIWPNFRAWIGALNVDVMARELPVQIVSSEPWVGMRALTQAELMVGKAA